MSEEENRLAFERDLAVRQAKLSKADLQVAQVALNKNRPLEALRTINNAVDRLDEELEAIADVKGGLTYEAEAETHE